MRERSSDGGKPRGACCAEGECDAVEKECGGERSEQEVLKRGFGALAGALTEAGEDVGGDGRDLEADEDEQQLDGRGHEQHADGTEEDEGEVLAHIAGFRTHRIDGSQQSDEHGTADQQMKEDAEGIGLQDAEVGGAGREAKLPGAGGECRQHGQDAEPSDTLAARGARQERIDQHDEDAGDGEDDLGKDAVDGIDLHVIGPPHRTNGPAGDAAVGWATAGGLLNPCTPPSMARIQ